MHYSKNYTEKDWQIIKSYQWFINYALLKEVIPSLRKLIMEWDSQTSTICFYFYHDGPLSEVIENHYRSISYQAHYQSLLIDVNMDYKVIRLDYPEDIPKREFVIYGRKEPFLDPVDDSPPPKGETAFYRESYERPLPENIEYTEKDWEIIGDFRWYVSRALWNEVIPSLRQVTMQWDPEEKIIWNVFFHDGPITDAIQEQYGFIDSLSDCDMSEGVQTCYKIIRIDYPKPLPKTPFVIYARKEPFVDHNAD